MSPQVTAAVIAASVGVITVIATVVTQYLGRRATSRDTQVALEAQRVQLDRTISEQRTRTLNERFATAAGQLGSDKPPEVRLAGVYAMAGLADDWPENRQTCVDVLCGYLRIPYEPDPGDEAPRPERLAFRAIREVRHTVIRVITAHLRADAMVSWQGLNFDFTGVFFDDGDFTSARFSGGTVSFDRAGFSGGTVRFDRAEFSSGSVDFRGAGFSRGRVSFDGAVFSGFTVNFSTENSPAARSASAPNFPAARSASTTPRSPVERSAFAVPGSPAAWSASTVGCSPAARSTSPTPGSPAARSASEPPSYPAARLISVTSAIGHARPRSHGQTRRRRA